MMMAEDTEDTGDTGDTGDVETRRCPTAASDGPPGAGGAG